MTYHSVLQKDQQYIDALNFSLNLADDIQKTIKKNCTTCKDVEVFPYRWDYWLPYTWLDNPCWIWISCSQCSCVLVAFVQLPLIILVTLLFFIIFPQSVFEYLPVNIVLISICSVWHVYYEQYLYVANQTWLNLGICLAAVFAVTFFFLGCDAWSALIAVIVIAMIVNSMFGLMYLWDISLNAVSLVNLVMVCMPSYFWMRVKYKYISNIYLSFCGSNQRSFKTVFL